MALWCHAHRALSPLQAVVMRALPPTRQQQRSSIDSNGGERFARWYETENSSKFACPIGLQPNFSGVQNRIGAIFFLTTLIGLASMSALDVFIHERSTFIRERASGCYNTATYFLAKSFFELLPMRALPPVLMGTIAYWMMGFQVDVGKFFVFVCVLLLANMVASTVAMAVGTVAPSIAVGNLITVMLMLLFIMFGGFVVSNTSIPVYIGWLRYISFVNYAVEVLVVNEFSGLLFLLDPTGFTNIQVSGVEVSRAFGFSAENITRDVLLLLALLAFFLVFTFVLLRFVVKERR